MRQLILIALVFGLSCNKAPVKNELIGEWVETQPNTGFVMDFKPDGKVNIGNIRIDSTKTLDYELDARSGQLSLRDILFFGTIGQVEHLTKDRFTLVTTDSAPGQMDWRSRNFFTKIENVRPSTTRDGIVNSLQNSAWTLKGKEDSLRIDFGSSRRWNSDNELFEATTHYWQSTPSKSREGWDIGEYNGKLFLICTNHQTETGVWQIKEFGNSKITLTEQTYVIREAVTLVRKTRISDEQNRRIVERLISKRWISSKVDTINTGEEQWIQENDERLRIGDIVSKFEFSFNSDHSFLFHINGKEFQKGNWKISNDGEFIMVDDGKNLHNWIQLRISNDQLTLSKLQEIRTDDLTVKVYMLIISIV